MAFSRQSVVGIPRTAVAFAMQGIKEGAEAPRRADHSTSQEEIEFSRLTTTEPVPTEPTESSSLTEFAKKAALD